MKQVFYVTDRLNAGWALVLEAHSRAAHKIYQFLDEVLREAGPQGNFSLEPDDDEDNERELDEDDQEEDHDSSGETDEDNSDDDSDVDPALSRQQRLRALIGTAHLATHAELDIEVDTDEEFPNCPEGDF
jgi:hypothetical protein